MQVPSHSELCLHLLQMGTVLSYTRINAQWSAISIILPLFHYHTLLSSVSSGLRVLCLNYLKNLFLCTLLTSFSISLGCADGRGGNLIVASKDGQELWVLHLCWWQRVTGSAQSWDWSQPAPANCIDELWSTSQLLGNCLCLSWSIPGFGRQEQVLRAKQSCFPLTFSLIQCWVSRQQL